MQLLSDLAARIPVLVLAEDAQWLDPSTTDVLTFVARRLEAEPIGLLVAVREAAASALLAADIPELRVESLDAAVDPGAPA